MKKAIAVAALMIVATMTMATSRNRHVVVILEASYNYTDLTVYSTTSSKGAPNVAAGDNFAQAIADLMDAGFEVKQWGYTTILAK